MILKYTIEENGELFSETDTFKPHEYPFARVTIDVIDPLNENRKHLGEPLLKLLKVEVVNPHVHLHDWEETYFSKFTNKQHFECKRCKITGFKRQAFHRVEREKPHHIPKYELCKDPLKKIPINLFPNP